MRRLGDLPKLGLMPLDLRLVSPQAEMDPEVGRIATFRITETREDGFELGVRRYSATVFLLFSLHASQQSHM